MMTKGRGTVWGTIASGLVLALLLRWHAHVVGGLAACLLLLLLVWWLRRKRAAPTGVAGWVFALILPIATAAAMGAWLISEATPRQYNLARMNLPTMGTALERQVADAMMDGRLTHFEAQTLERGLAATGRQPKVAKASKWTVATERKHLESALRRRQKNACRGVDCSTADNDGADPQLPPSPRRHIPS